MIEGIRNMSKDISDDFILFLLGYISYDEWFLNMTPEEIFDQLYALYNDGKLPGG
jgi:hypothetical protein